MAWTVNGYRIVVVLLASLDYPATGMPPAFRRGSIRGREWLSASPFRRAWRLLVVVSIWYVFSLGSVFSSLTKRVVKNAANSAGQSAMVVKVAAQSRDGRFGRVVERVWAVIHEATAGVCHGLDASDCSARFDKLVYLREGGVARAVAC